MLRDLELQWQDHFHMRDQTWKTLSTVALLFLGIVGLEFKDAGHFVMFPAYIVLILSTGFGWAIAAHHRDRQQQKFACIEMYEKKLGLYALKKSIIKPPETQKSNLKKTLIGKLFTARFIEVMHACIGSIALVLLLKRSVEILAT